MTYDQVLTLVTIVEEGSFKAAASKMAKTQPSLSVAIKKLEEEYQIQLFDRSEYRPKLTAQGKSFYERAKESLKGFHQLDVLARELAAGVEPTIRLSVEAISPISKIKDTLCDLNKTNFSTNLELSVDIIEGSIDKLLNGEVDMAISAIFDEHTEIEKEKLFELTMIPVVSRENVDSYMSTINELKMLPQIVVRSTGSKRNQTGSGLLEGGKKWYLSDNSLKKEMITSGLGWGRLPCHQIKEQLKTGELVEIPFKEIESFDIDIYLLRNKKYPQGKIAKQLWTQFLTLKEQ